MVIKVIKIMKLISDSNEMSLIHWVCQYSCMELFQILKNMGCIFYSITKTQDTPMHFAVQFGQTEIVREVIIALINYIK